MAGDNVSLKYTGEFDGSQMATALQAVDKEFENVGKAATKAFSAVSDAEATQAQLAKTHAAMRAASQKEQADAAIKTAEKEAEAIARIQAKAEAEYERVNSKAIAAEAAAGAGRMTRAVEKENAYHAQQMRALAGNHEAQEAETRRHAATMIQIEEGINAKGAAGTRAAIQRFGAIGNQIQSLQIAFLGVSGAADGADNKTAKMIGTVGNLAAAGLGMAAAYDVAAASFAGMGASMAIAMPILAAVGVGLALILEHRKALAELAKSHDWMGDPAKYAQVTAAVAEYDEAHKGLNRTVQASAMGFGNYAGLLDANSQAMQRITAANEKLQAITGLTRDELVKLYGTLEKAKDAFGAVDGQRMFDLQLDMERALIAGKKDSLEKQLQMQEIANKQATRSIKEHYGAVILDAKKTTEEKKKALEKEGVELALQEKINQALLVGVRESFANKKEKKEDSKEAQVLKEYHRMAMESATQFDKAIGDMEDDKFSKTMGHLNAELDAVERTYAEKKTAAHTTALALVELDQWYANEQGRIMALATAAGQAYNLATLKDYEDYAASRAKMDATIKQDALNLSMDLAGAKRQAITDQEDAEKAAIEKRRAQWVLDGVSEVEAKKRADDLIAKNHEAAQGKMRVMDKATAEQATQARLQGINAMLSASQGFVSAVAGQNKALFLISKGLAAAQIVISGMVAEAMIEAQLGILAAAPFVAMQKVATGIQLATVAATAVTGFRKGTSWTGNGPRDEVAGVVHRQEAVWSAEDVDRAGGPGAVEAMRQGGGRGGDTYNFGSTTVVLPAGATEEQAYQAGQAVARGQVDEIRAFQRMEKLSKRMGPV